VRNFLDYAVFVVFFPELVAGPIVRADVFFPQYFGWRRPGAEEVREALALILGGLVKKMVFADRFGLAADDFFGHIKSHPGPVAAWTGVLAFTFQIFFDFSGYTDIARGCALLLGIRFPLNFRRPYLARNVAEFWQRWHMSLSAWLRDYLFFPLGGNRGGRLRTYRNLMLTMLLGGLWHGASWNFVVWGGLHGLFLVVHRLFGRAMVRLGLEERLANPLLVPVRIGLTLLSVVLAWVFFRARTFGDAGRVLGAMFSGGWAVHDSLLGPGAIALILISAVLAVLEEKHRLLERIQRGGLGAQTAIYAVQLLCLELFAVTEAQVPFIYFQF
jgi:alginate O-acetyltransferase complex protein AlgI